MGSKQSIFGSIRLIRFLKIIPKIKNSDSFTILTRALYESRECLIAFLTFMV